MWIFWCFWQLQYQPLMVRYSIINNCHWIPKLVIPARIGDPTKTGRYCEIHQGYLALSNFIWWYVILIVIIEILKILKLYMALSESPCFPDVYARVKVHSHVSHTLLSCALSEICHASQAGMCSLCSMSHILNQPKLPIYSNFSGTLHHLCALSLPCHRSQQLLCTMCLVHLYPCIQ